MSLTDHKIYYFQCDECKVPDIPRLSNNQRYCNICKPIVKKRENKKRNALRYALKDRECEECGSIVKEKGMIKRCRACINKTKKDTVKYCRRCKTTEIDSRFVVCPECLQKNNQERVRKYREEKNGKRICRNTNCNVSLDGKHRSIRYCSDECKGLSPLTFNKYDKKRDETGESILKDNNEIEEEKKFSVNPYFLQPLGSKRRLKILLKENQDE